MFRGYSVLRCTKYVRFALNWCGVAGNGVVILRRPSFFFSGFLIAASALQVTGCSGMQLALSQQAITITWSFYPGCRTRSFVVLSDPPADPDLTISRHAYEIFEKK